MRKIFLFAILLFTAMATQAQNNANPCAAPEASQFDFWVGDWTLYSADTITGSNSIYKIMDGCSVQENFSSPKSGYVGKSWSVYSPQARQWQQTWVDNQGGYIALTGAFEGGKMTLSTAPRKLPNGKELISRMIFYNITNDSFDWNWEATTDAGASWKVNWKIHYIRKK